MMRARLEELSSCVLGSGIYIQKTEETQVLFTYGIWKQSKGQVFDGRSLVVTNLSWQDRKGSPRMCIQFFQGPFAKARKN